MGRCSLDCVVLIRGGFVDLRIAEKKRRRSLEKAIGGGFRRNAW